NITENVFAVHSWYELKLQVAQKENNISEVQRVSFRFIKSGFSEKYYKIYKSTFAKEEWHEKVENLIQHYGKHYNNNWFNSSIADVLQAEKQRERLLKYVEKYLSVDYLAKYYAEFSSHFPERTLALFLRAIDGYAKNNTGREHYERIANLFRRMVKIEGGKKLAEEMIAQYRILYKKRKAMMDVLDGIKL
ncbi:MAG: hypothetical protein LBH25_09660, partial [Fibromonadaceae bacterium]|nr:hypothetical protein [Fibromonadaceae bacterium]